MALKINAKDCCGDHCKIAEDAHESNISEEEIREGSCCCNDDCDCCSEEWPDD